MEIMVYVPMVDSRMRGEIEAGSGIVGESARSEDLIIIDEVAASDLVHESTFADRIAAAASDLVHGPVRRSLVGRDGFTAVGSWDDAQRVLMLQPGCASVVAAWLGCDAVDPTELQVSRS